MCQMDLFGHCVSRPLHKEHRVRSFFFFFFYCVSSWKWLTSCSVVLKSYLYTVSHALPGNTVRHNAWLPGPILWVLWLSWLWLPIRSTDWLMTVDDNILNIDIQPQRVLSTFTGTSHENANAIWRHLFLRIIIYECLLRWPALDMNIPWVSAWWYVSSPPLT